MIVCDREKTAKYLACLNNPQNFTIGNCQSAAHGHTVSVMRGIAGNIVFF